MQSNNPVFSRSEGFNGRGSVATADPSQWQVDLDGGAGAPTAPAGTGRMTLDEVVEKTAISLGVLTIVAAVAWFWIGDIYTADGNVDSSAASKAYMLAIGGAFGGLALSLVNSFKRVISPALVLAFAAVEGAFVGAFSKTVATYVGDETIVFQAVLATIVAFAGTLAAYKFFNIQVTDRFRKVVTIAMFAAVGMFLVNFVLSLTGVVDNGGIAGFTTLGLVVAIAMVVLAVFMLILDFDFIERGIAAGLPERESWRAAFGLTVTLVWLYIELLRILAILRGDN